MVPSEGPSVTLESDLHSWKHPFGTIVQLDTSTDEIGVFENTWSLRLMSARLTPAGRPVRPLAPKQ